MAKREKDTEKPTSIYVEYFDKEQGRAAFKSKFKSRFGKSERQSLFLRLEKEERRRGK